MKRTIRQLAVLAVLLGAWELAFRVIRWRDWLFPAPATLFTSFREMLGGASGHALEIGLFVSMTRLVPGFALSVLIGSLIGGLLWRFPAIDEVVGGALLGFQTLPSVCWVPLAILVLGLNESAILFVMIAGSVFAVAIAFRDGLRQTPRTFMVAGRMLGAHGLRLYRHVLFPASLPALSSGLRQGFSFAWRSLMGAELLFMLERKGLGYLLHEGREFADVAQVVAIIIVMVIVGMFADRFVFATIERRIHRRFGLG
jgi:NitT/TauT family transport system permease protein